MEIVQLDQPMSGYLRRCTTTCADTYQDFNVYSQQLQPKLIDHCQQLRQHDLQSYKLHIRIKVKFHKLLDAEETCDAFFSNRQSTILPGTNITNEITSILSLIANRIEDFCENGSDWTILEIRDCDIHIARYQAISGASSTFVDLPPHLRNKEAVINVRNDGNKCFKWALLSALHPPRHNPQRQSSYKKYTHLYNFTSYEYPFTVNQIPQFEAEHNISIYVYGYENMIYPVYRPNVTHEKTVMLLLISNPDNEFGHYCWIKNLNRLLSSTTKHGGKRHFCPICLFSFVTQERLNVHYELCQSDCCAVTMPKKGRNVLKFNATAKMLRQPCVFYADFECLLQPLHVEHQRSAASSHTTRTAHHIPCGFGLFQVIQCCDTHPPLYPKPVYVERHEHVIQRFLETVVTRSVDYHNTVLEKRQPMPVLSGQEWNFFFTSETCIICEKPFASECCQHLDRRRWCKDCRSKICRDHCHICRRFRGPAHSECNISYKLSRDVCVYLHNLRRYDGHLIMQGIGKFAEKRNLPISCLPKGLDSYIMFSLTMPPVNERSGSWKITFLDTFQFLSTSLDNLVRNLLTAGPSTFKAVHHHATSHDKKMMLLRKGVYPYEYMDDWEKFQETNLPPKDAFNSTLTASEISVRDYSHAQSIWDMFEIENMGQYHDVYLATDTLLLCDVFENFRSICIKNYKLDPAHFATLPSFGWCAVLKSSPVHLELLTDPDMYTFFEGGIRGGISTVAMRYAAANNKMLPNYNSALPTSYIASFDANNLYGYSMSQMLPTSNFVWMSKTELERLDVLQIPDDSDYGCVVEVDLRYPQQLHDMHNNYPLAPEHITVSDDQLSPYCTKLKRKHNFKFVNQQKLIPNLNDKRRYVVHYANLKLYLRLGMELIQIHRGIKFKQHAWMKPYILFNTEQRKLATSDFEKDLFKLLNNSVFGKSMENVRAYVDVKLLTKDSKIRKLIASPRFNKFEVFNENLVGIMMNKKCVSLSKPIYVGFTVLESSKLLMYDFHYNFINVHFQNNKLLFTDTDSLTYFIETDNLYQMLAAYSDHFDFSDYSASHFLYSTKNKKVMGKMKDETNGVPIEEFIGLRSKMYSIKCDNFSKKRAKGVSKTIVKKQLTHDDYKRALADTVIMRHQSYKIGNKGHQLFTLLTNKVSLSAYDDKRYIRSNGIETLAYGHYAIEQLDEIDSDNENQ